MKIVSGGQTGVDRAALDVAMKHGVDCGGWCPTGRADELGKIPDRYPVRELEQGGFAERTLRNVSESDGTAIIHQNELHGGTAFTRECCEQLNRPRLLIDASTLSPEKAVQKILEFVRKHHVQTLNVAGPRQSEWPEGYGYALSVLELFLSCGGRRAACDL